jgi:hypothetical protein
MRVINATESIVLQLLAGAACLLLLLPRPVRAQEPHPVGEPLSTTISFGDEYTSSVELYDARITVLEIVRGPKASDVLRKAAASTPRPRSGFEYLLVRIRFEFSARGAPGDKSYMLTPTQFSIYSAAGNEPAADIPELEYKLGGALRSGESVEGWLVFSVAQEDERPVLNFIEDVQSVLRGGTGIRFKLY